MYLVFIEGKTIVFENFNGTVMLMNLQNSNNSCYMDNYLISFILVLFVLFFIALIIAIAKNKFKCFIDNRNIKLLNIQPESDNID